MLLNLTRLLCLTLLFVSSSILQMNAQGNIMTLEQDGDTYIGSLAGVSSGIVIADQNGKLSRFDGSNYTMRTNLNTPDSPVNNTTWSPAGPNMTFTKLHDYTIIEAKLFSNVRFTGATINSVQYRVEIIGQNNNGYAPGKIYDESTWRFTSSTSVYKSLPAGTYTAQIHVRSNSGSGTVFLDNNGTIVIEERL